MRHRICLSLKFCIKSIIFPKLQFFFFLMYKTSVRLMEQVVIEKAYKQHGAFYLYNEKWAGSPCKPFRHGSKAPK